MEDNIEDEEVEDEPDEPDERHVTLPNNAKAIFFYEGNGLYNEFTSAGPYPITFRGKQYPTAEHLYQARKFLDHRPTLAEHIRRGSDRPRFALTEARRFQNETRQDWNDICISVMDEILELKFSQHVILRRMLVATGSRILIYSCGKYDDFLGNGADGNRRNELGLALMRLRSKLTKREVIEEK
ncbi:hypothetical protein FRB90_012570 [Tulasnella sp. 427]|nr:hypothetical protein FRB90_012570 [Tulasnella sp. 427]